MFKPPKKIPLIFALTFVVCTVTRYLQYSAVVNVENGFFMNNGGFLNDAYYVFIAISAALFLLFSIISENPKITRLYAPDAAFGGVIAVSCGILYAYAAIEPNPFNPLLLVGAIGFVYVGVSVFIKKRLMPSAAPAFLILAVFYTIKAAAKFMAVIYIRNLSAELIVMLGDLFAAVFFLAAGKAFIRAFTKPAAVLTKLCGYTSALLVFSEGFARYIYYYTSESDIRRAVLAADNGFTFSETAFLTQGAVILWLIYVLTVKKRKTKVNRFENSDQISDKEAAE